MKIIITNINPYKEKDAIMNGISEEGLCSFRVPGLFSPKSKFASLNNPLTIIEPVFSESKTSKHLILKEASLLFSPMSGQLDFNYVSAVSILLQATNNLIEDDDKALLYQDLFQAVLALKNKINPYLVTLKYLIAVMNNTGYELNVNSCIGCGGKKNIVAFSFLEGGFICKDCMKEGYKNDLEIDEMKTFRNVYLHNGYAFDSHNYEQKIIVSLLKKINIFISDAYGYSITSINNL